MTSRLDPVIVSKLNSGAIGVLATDTVYGVVCRAEDQAAVMRLYKLKDRENKPGTVIATSSRQLEALGLKREDIVKAESYWPNPISVVIPALAPSLEHLTLGMGSLAVRVPFDRELNALLMQTGPLLTSSANHPGQPPATTIQEAKEYFGGLVDFYIDGGIRPGKNSSTIIRITNETVEVIRQGTATIDKHGHIV